MVKIVGSRERYGVGRKGLVGVPHLCIHNGIDKWDYNGFDERPPRVEISMDRELVRKEL